MRGGLTTQKRDLSRTVSVSFDIEIFTSRNCSVSVQEKLFLFVCDARVSKLNNSEELEALVSLC